jgi:hypothetical protein
MEALALMEVSWTTAEESFSAGILTPIAAVHLALAIGTATEGGRWIADSYQGCGPQSPYK